MKKVICLFLVFLLSLNVTKAISVIGQNIFHQGIHSGSDLLESFDNVYNIENVSSVYDALVLIYDSEEIQHQALRLPPKSGPYKSLPIKKDYKFIILGDNAEVYIYPKK